MALLEAAAIGLPHWVASYLAELTARNYSPSTIRFRRAALARLRMLIDRLGVGNLSVLSRATLRRYQTALSEHRQSNGNPLAWTTQAEELIAIKGFLRWCVRARLLRRSPDDVIVLPRRPRRLPRGS